MQRLNLDGVGKNVLKPIVKTASCQAPHTQYVVSGRVKVVMDDGTEEEFGPGDAAVIPPGHNAWVVGNEPVVAIDFTGPERLREKGLDLDKKIILIKDRPTVGQKVTFL